MTESLQKGTWVPLLIAVLFVTSLIAGCLGQDDADVLGTFYPMTFLAEEIAGDTVTVGQTIPSGMEPHEWDPSVRDLSRLGSARLVVAQGLSFEPWLERTLGNLGEDAPRVVHTADHLGDLLDEEDDEDPDGDSEDHDDQDEAHDEQDDDHDHGPVDPHTWLDPVLFAHQAIVVRDAMIEAFPEHENTFMENAADLLQRLDDLDAAFQDRLETCETRNIVVLHDAFSYLGERYAFEIHSVTGQNPTAEPDPRSVARIVDTALEHELSVVFTETLANPSVMDAIAQDASGKGGQVEVRVLSPLERRSPEDSQQNRSFVDIMYTNLDELASAMRCTPP